MTVNRGQGADNTVKDQTVGFSLSSGGTLKYINVHNPLGTQISVALGNWVTAQIVCYLG